MKGSFTILLGESRYYYAVNKEGKLSIKETSKPSFPDEEGIVKQASVWGDNPVTTVGEGSRAGKRLGVYWETQKPRPDGVGNLPAGLIRLIGKYWTVDSIYKVKLVATGVSLTHSITIEIKKPGELGNSEYARARRNTMDVHNRPLDVDSLCVHYGGVFGIPPQLSNHT